MNSWIVACQRRSLLWGSDSAKRSLSTQLRKVSHGTLLLSHRCSYRTLPSITPLTIYTSQSYYLASSWNRCFSTNAWEDTDDAHLENSDVPHTTDDIHAIEASICPNSSSKHNTTKQTPHYSLQINHSTSPLREINNYYIKHHALLQVVPNAFVLDSWRESPTGRLWYTATFTCPVTGNTSVSGTLQHVPTTIYQRRDMRVWYSSKKQAMHAAAGRRLDRLQWQYQQQRQEASDTTVNVTNERYCWEAPRLSDAELLLAAKDEVDNEEEEEIDATTKDIDAITNVKNTNNVVIVINHSMSPLNEILAYYGKYHAISGGMTAAFSVESRREPKRVLFMATFTCPVTGETTPSGILKGISRDRYEIRDNRIWYNSKKQAMHAAAGRWLDHLQRQYQQQQDCNIVNPTNEIMSDQWYCLDDVQSNDAELFLDAEEDGEVAVDAPGIITEIVDENERTYHIRYVRSSKSIPFIFDEGTQSNSSNDANTTLNAKFTKDPLIVCSHMKDKAREWILQVQEKLNPTSNSFIVSPHTVANIVQQGRPLLRALANAYMAIPFSHAVAAKTASSVAEDNTSTGFRIPFDGNVEQTATKILRLLLNHSQRPLVDSDFACYLRCLHGPTPKKVAQRATQLVTNMKMHNKWMDHVVPPPGVETYNALVQIRAQVGGKDGRSDLSRNSDMAWNRDSYVNVLSCLAYENETFFEESVFDYNFAYDCIQTMKEKSQTDPSFIPDIQVYNAPLRWAGGNEFHRTRPYARAIAWDNYEQLLNEAGFHPLQKESTAWKNALAIERWVQFIESEAVNNEAALPTIETYEALIQAWVRTGTREGLQRAEDVAHDLLSSKMNSFRTRPRLQTFHPIFSACLFSRDDKLISYRIPYWIRRLESKEIETLQPDGRIYSTLCNQYLLMQQPQSALRLRRRATVCEGLLSKLQDSIENGGADMDLYNYSMYLDVTKLWCSVVKASAMTNRKKGCGDRALNRLENVMLSYEEAVALIAKAEAPLYGAQRNSKRPLLQEFERIVSLAPHIYLNYLTSLREVRNAAGVGKLGELNSRHVLAIERIVRRVGELYKYMDQDTNTQTETASDILSSSVSILPRLKTYDLFEYPTAPSNKHNWTDVIESVISLLESLRLNEADEGDILRLARLTKSLAQDMDVSLFVRNRADQVLDDAMEIMRQSMEADSKKRVNLILAQPISIRRRSTTSDEKPLNHSASLHSMMNALIKPTPSHSTKNPLSTHTLPRSRKVSLDKPSSSTLPGSKLKS
jgi:hypothetical protein